MQSPQTSKIWVDDSKAPKCSRCKTLFDYKVFKHHCRSCGNVFCDACSQQKLMIPETEFIRRPTNWLHQLGAPHDNDFRVPHRVCDPCTHRLRDLQGQLRSQFAVCHNETIVDVTSFPTLPSIDFKLEDEIRKATIMVNNFMSSTHDQGIPKTLIEISKGLVFLTVLKAGFVFTGKFGTGLVLTKGENGSWGAPSALMISGIGWGFQVGAELTDLLIILTSDAAVDAFKSRAQVSVGTELSISVGPVGRGIGSDVSAGNKGAAHAFSYSHSRGVYAGISLEAAGIATCKEVNQAFYGETVSTSSLLNGEYPPPRAANPLYRALQLFSEGFTGTGTGTEGGSILGGRSISTSSSQSSLGSWIGDEGKSSLSSSSSSTSSSSLGRSYSTNSYQPSFSPPLPIPSSSSSTSNTNYNSNSNNNQQPYSNQKIVSSNNNNGRTTFTNSSSSSSLSPSLTSNYSSSSFTSSSSSSLGGNGTTIRSTSRYMGTKEEGEDLASALAVGL